MLPYVPVTKMGVGWPTAEIGQSSILALRYCVLVCTLLAERTVVQ